MTPRVSVSVCVLACDEEALLPRCLDSVEWADELVIVVDEKSRDGSEKIARERAQRVEVRPYAGDVAQKRYCTELARNDWVLVIDPDEVMTPQLAEGLRRELSAAGPELAGLEVNRITRHLGRWLRHGDFYPDWKLRAFRRSRARWHGRDPHGRVAVDGLVRRLEGDLQHYSYEDLADQVERIQFFSDQAAQAAFERGERVTWSQLFLNPPARFFRAYVIKRGFLDGIPGFIVAAATAFHVFLKYAKLWEREQRGRA